MFHFCSRAPGTACSVPRHPVTPRQWQASVGWRMQEKIEKMGVFVAILLSIYYVLFPAIGTAFAVIGG
jgi:hypothetical protein